MANKNDKILNVAQKYLAKGQYDKAVKELQKIVDEDPSDVRTWLKIGDIHSKKGDKAKATEVYRRVAEFYGEQGFFLKAVAVYKQVLKYDPSHIEVTLKLAELYEHLGLMQEAMSQYQALATIHDQAGNARESLAVLQRIVDLDPENVASRVKLAESYSRDGMTNEAVSQFERAADILKKQGRQNDFVKVAERLVYHDPSKVDVIKDLAKIYLEREDTKRALAKLQICFKAQPKDVETLTLLAASFHALGQVQKTVFVYRELAKLYQERSQNDQARVVFQKILELAPGDPEAAAVLGVNAPRPSVPARAPKAPSIPPPAPEKPRAPARAAPRPAPAAHVSEPPPPAPAPAARARPAPKPKPESEPPAASGGLARRKPSKNEQVSKLLTETDVYIKYGLRDRAVEHLEKVLELEPDSVDAYAKMRDIYINGRDHLRAAEAIASMIRIHVRLGDKDSAEIARQELVGLAPGHPAALRGAFDNGAEPPVWQAKAEAGEDSLDDIDIDVGDEAEPAAAREDLSVEGLDEAVDQLDEGFEQLEEPAAARPSSTDIGAKTDDLGALAEEHAPGGAFEASFAGEVSSAPIGDADIVESNADILEPDSAARDPSETAGRRTWGAPGEVDTKPPEPMVEQDEPMLAAEPMLEAEPMLQPERAAAAHDDFGLIIDSVPEDEPLVDHSQAMLDDEPLDAMPPSNEPIDAEVSVNDLLPDSDLEEVTGAQILELSAPPEQRSAASGMADDLLAPGGMQGEELLDEMPLADALEPLTEDDDEDPELEDELESAGFLVQQGLLSEARDAVLEVLRRKPFYSRAISMLDEVEVTLGMRNAPPPDPSPDISPNVEELGAVETEAQTDLAVAAEPAPLTAEPQIQEEEYVDPLAGLDEESTESGMDGPPAAWGGVPEEPAMAAEPAYDPAAAPAGDEPGPFDVAQDESASAEPPRSDASSDERYDLGLAYKEMGLYDDAIAEFEQAAAGTTHAMESLVMIGQCLRAKGDHLGAVSPFFDAFQRAQDPDTSKTLKLEIAFACEAGGELGKAIEWYEAVLEDDPNQPDALERLQILRDGAGGNGTEGDPGTNGHGGGGVAGDPLRGAQADASDKYF